MTNDDPTKDESESIDSFNENEEIRRKIKKLLPKLKDKMIGLREEAADTLSELAADHAEYREILLPLLLKHTIKEEQWAIINNNILFHISFIPRQHTEWAEQFLSTYIELASVQDDRVFAGYVVRSYAFREIWEFISRRLIKLDHPKLGKILQIVSNGLHRTSMERAPKSDEVVYMLKIKDWYETKTGESIEPDPIIFSPPRAKSELPPPIIGADTTENNDQITKRTTSKSVSTTNRLVKSIVNSSKIEVGSKIRPNEQDALNQVNELIGLKSVKIEVEQTINEIKYQKLLMQHGEPPVTMSRHMVFTGNPGTGKTTIARLLGEIYKRLGVLSRGHMVETDRAGLVAGYLGQTAIRTDEVISTALGGILFIDEAYALTTQERDMYGQEAVDTLLKRMEDHRDNLIVIVAGYPIEMERFIDANPGLRSRFTKFLHFDDYTADELKQIYEVLLKSSGHMMSSDSGAHLAAIFHEMDNMRGEKFGNGRAVRNLYERTIRNVASRVIKTMPSNIKQILPEDISFEDVHAVLRSNTAKDALVNHTMTTSD